MEDKRARASFEEYWVEVVQEPFDSWRKLEETYRFAVDNDPGLMNAPFAEAQQRVAELAANTEKLPGGATYEQCGF